jgi:hypothetical protein
MFGRKKPPKEPDYSKMPVLPNKLAEFVQAKYGLTPDELLKLAESLGRVNENIKVSRRRKVNGKEYSKLVGKVLTIAEAVKYERERVESRHGKDQKIKELLEEIDFDELMVRKEVNDAIYPQRLSPTDIVHYVDAAGEKLDALDRDRAREPKVYSVREETILDVITLIKKQEPYRVARRIADRQKAYVLEHTMEELEAEYAEWLRQLRGDPTEEERLAMEEAERLAAEEVAAEEERLAAEEAARNFGDLASVHTLLDEASELIRDNPDAAAAIIRQWIGNAVLMENRS